MLHSSHKQTPKKLLNSQFQPLQNTSTPTSYHLEYPPGDVSYSAVEAIR